MCCERIVIDLEIYLPSVLCSVIVDFIRLTDIEKLRNWLTSEKQPKRIVARPDYIIYCSLALDREKVAFGNQLYRFKMYPIQDLVAFAHRQPCLIVKHWFHDLDAEAIDVHERLGSVLALDAIDVELLEVQVQP